MLDYVLYRATPCAFCTHFFTLLSPVISILRAKLHKKNDICKYFSDIRKKICTFLIKYLHMSENCCNFAANLKVHYLVDHQTVYRININK